MKTVSNPRFKIVQGRRVNVDPAVPHGKRIGYQYWLCQCDKCTAANSKYQDKFRKGGVVTVQIPGVGWQRAADGQFPLEQEAAWKRLNEFSKDRRYGAHGFARVVRIENEQISDDLVELRDYLDGCAGAAWAGLGDQRGDPEAYHSVRSEAEACTLACQRITEALDDDWKPEP
jgi:hypothetical protein